MAKKNTGKKRMSKKNRKKVDHASFSPMVPPNEKKRKERKERDEVK